jgi:hypothetical protein
MAKRHLTVKQKLAGFGGKRAQSAERGARHRKGSVRYATSSRRTSKRKTTKSKAKGSNALLAGLLGAAGGAVAGYGARTVQDIVSQPNNPLTNAVNKLLDRLGIKHPATDPVTSGSSVPLPTGGGGGGAMGVTTYTPPMLTVGPGGSTSYTDPGAQIMYPGGSPGGPIVLGSQGDQQQIDNTIAQLSGLGYAGM